jgi:hypothetical protein
MTMNYMELISRSFQNAWRYKFLWLFGFMVAIADVGEVLLKDDDHGGDWSGDLVDLGIDPALLVSIGIIALTLWMVFWFLGVLSEGALIHGILRKERGQETDFMDCWSAGLLKFLRLFGIMLVAILFVVTFILLLVALVAPGFIIATPIGVVLLLVALPLMFAAIITIICVEGWALRYAVIHDVPWLQSLQQGWQLFKQNIGPSLAVAITSVAAQALLFCAVLFCLAVMSVPFLLMGLGGEQSVILPGAVAAGLFLVLFLAMTGTFSSSYWTLAFLRLTETPKQT